MNAMCSDPLRHRYLIYRNRSGFPTHQSHALALALAPGTAGTRHATKARCPVPDTAFGSAELGSVPAAACELVVDAEAGVPAVGKAVDAAAAAVGTVAVAGEMDTEAGSAVVAVAHRRRQECRLTGSILWLMGGNVAVTVAEDSLGGEHQWGWRMIACSTLEDCRKWTVDGARRGLKKEEAARLMVCGRGDHSMNMELAVLVGMAPVHPVHCTVWVGARSMVGSVVAAFVNLYY